jgi:type IV fimbrial biogenesis protein FimT
LLMFARQLGVTLIELLVGVAIVALVMALAMPSYSTWLQNSRLRGGAESILAGLQLARAEAVRRNTTVWFGVAGASVWSVCLVAPTVTATATTVTCAAANTVQAHTANDAAGATVTVGTFAVDGVTAGGGNPVGFNNLGRLVTLPTAFNVDNSALTTANSRDLRVVIDAGGAARMCDPAVIAPDSRAC